jgi:hypothetical protein
MNFWILMIVSITPCKTHEYEIFGLQFISSMPLKLWDIA